MLLREAEVQVLNVTHTAVAQELVEILIHRAKRSGACPAQMLREHGSRLALLAKLEPCPFRLAHRHRIQQR
ncbi:hypothetical protein GCM10008965_31300 [Methylorubrum aminovorans]|nr:hypothetical protein GCM10025880_06010 [Methylorubrum aminovorans]